MKAARIVLIEDQDSGVAHELTKFTSGEEGVRVLRAPAQENEFVPDANLLGLNTPKGDGSTVRGKLKRCPRPAGVPNAVLTSSYVMSDKQRTGPPGQPVHSQAVAAGGVSRRSGASCERDAKRRTHFEYRVRTHVFRSRDASEKKDHAKWQISNSGGVRPFWLRNGHELVYWSDDTFMTVSYPIKGDTFVDG